MSFENLELPCIWVPAGGKLPATPWSDPAVFRAIFIPDGYQGPRPGYPWIEFGRMSLRVRKPRGTRAANSVATSPGARQSWSQSGSAPRAVTLGQVAAGPLAPSGGNSDGTRLEAKAYPGLGATVRSWTDLSDLRATMSALDALKPSNPWVASAARGVGGSSGEEVARGAAKDRAMQLTLTEPPQLASVQKEEEEQEKQIGPLSPLTGTVSPRASEPTERSTITNPPVPIFGGGGGTRTSQPGSISNAITFRAEHYLSRLTAVGLDVGTVEAAVRSQIQAMGTGLAAEAPVSGRYLA